MGHLNQIEKKKKKKEETSGSPEQHIAVKKGRLSHPNEIKLEVFNGDIADEYIALSIDDSDGEEEPEIKLELFQADDNEESGTIVLSSDEETIKKEPEFFELKCNVGDANFFPYTVGSIINRRQYHFNRVQYPT